MFAFIICICDESAHQTCTRGRPPTEFPVCACVYICSSARSSTTFYRRTRACTRRRRTFIHYTNAARGRYGGTRAHTRAHTHVTVVVHLLFTQTNCTPLYYYICTRRPTLSRVVVLGGVVVVVVVFAALSEHCELTRF